jgi:alpha-L-fucosidase
MMRRTANMSMNGAIVGCLFFAALLAHAADEADIGTATNEPAVASSNDAAESVPYIPAPENLAAREWFQDAKFGVFIHWGVYTVLGRGEWVMNNEKMSNEDYERLAPKFNPTQFDAAAWVRLFKRAGAKYVTITAKHADGFAMWDSKVSNWDIVDRTPYRRDVLKQLAKECHRQGLRLFLYYSQLDWHHPDYYPRGTTGHASGRPNQGDWNAYLAYMDAQLAELLSGDRGEVGGIWFDGWWDQQTKRFPGHENASTRVTNVDWRLRRTYDLIHALQQQCLVGANHHVAPFEGEDFQMFERDLPGENQAGHSPDAKIGDLPLETCDTINDSWGYNASDKNYKSVRQLVQYLVKAAGRNANFLLNVGPRPDGTIDPEMVRRLEGIGKWMSQYGHTIRNTRSGPTGPQRWGTSTQTADNVYLHILDPSSTTDDGWLTLTETNVLLADDVRDALSGAPVASRRDVDGQLQVKIDIRANRIDLVLQVANSHD